MRAEGLDLDEGNITDVLPLLPTKSAPLPDARPTCARCDMVGRDSIRSGTKAHRPSRRRQELALYSDLGSTSPKPLCAGGT